MKSRRTPSTDFPIQPSSKSISDSARQDPHAPFAKSSSSSLSSSYPSRSVVDGGGYSINTVSSSPGRLEGLGENARHGPLQTRSSQRKTHSSTHQRRQSYHRRRSNPEGPSPSSIPYRPRIRSEAGEDCLRTASLDPPITKDSLSELDLNRIVNDTRLRHDLNFEHEIMFRPNTYGTRGAEKKREDNEYFEALVIEFAHYIRRQRNPASSSPQAGFTPPANMRPKSSSSRFPRRLPPMIVAISEVIKTLVPTAKWQSVDDQFDVDLRMQELEHGICDIAGLFEWIGKLLLCSCSPMRDPVVTAMVAKSQQAVIAQDPHQLVNSIKDLFGVLETMKLDVANHQIRYLRLYLLEESIQFEQNHILDRIAAGWSISRERRWFEIAYAHPEREDRFLMFKERVVDRIVTPTAGFPTALASDHERLKQLQHDFRLCHYHLACGHTFANALHRLGWKGGPPPQAYTDCMKHIGAIIGAQGPDFKFCAHPDVVLEIVRHAFKVCNIDALPDQGTLWYTEIYFREALNYRTAFYGEIEGTLWDELSRLVHAEVDAIFNMTPLEILNRYDSGPPGSSTNIHGAGDLSLESISKRAAHIIVLHWKVWAPIFYNQPDPAEPPTRTARAVAEAEEKAERTSGRVSMSSVNSSQPVVVQGKGRHRAHTASLSRGSTRSELAVYTPTSSDEGSTASEKLARSRRPSV
ncbi:MAG: hypothetical protein Q9166_002191 [cf. Caloplaca sp. 2 TL-2023]